MDYIQIQNPRDGYESPDGKTLVGQMVIMIVDDNVRVREMIRSLLAGTGATFYECSDGGEAVAAYDLCKPDWVLMDIVMKEMDGISATQAIRQKHPEAKIMIVTNYDDAGLREKAMRCGARAYCLKEDLSNISTAIFE